MRVGVPPQDVGTAARMSEQLESPLPPQPVVRPQARPPLAPVEDAPAFAPGTGPGTASTAPSTTPALGRRGGPGALLRGMRPRQWTKNLLVLGAPIASGRVFEPHVLVGAAVAFAVFCLAASCVYLVNDVRDLESDRRHPRKCRRAVACGDLSVRAAVVAAAVLGVGAIGLGFWWATSLGATIVVYLVVQAAYSLGLKDQPALDLAVVASGFLLRAIAGGEGAGLLMSPWFLLVATFGSLFMVAGKRYSELRRVGSTGGTRRSLESYSASYLRFIWSMAAGVTVVVYCLWALRGVGTSASGPPWGLISLAPFVLALLRYAADIDRGTAEQPEEVVLADRHLQVIGVAWLVLVLLQAMAR